MPFFVSIGQTKKFDIHTDIWNAHQPVSLQGVLLKASGVKQCQRYKVVFSTAGRGQLLPKANKYSSCNSVPAGRVGGWVHPTLPGSSEYS